MKKADLLEYILLYRTRYKSWDWTEGDDEVNEYDILWLSKTHYEELDLVDETVVTSNGHRENFLRAERVRVRRDDLIIDSDSSGGLDYEERFGTFIPYN